MKHKTLAAIAVATLTAASLAGCVSTAPPAIVSQPTVAQPAVQSDADAFLDAIASGFVIPDLPRQPVPEAAPLRQAVLDAAQETCPVLDYANGRAMAIAIAEDSLGDRSLFTAAMPVLFVDAADLHICR